MIGKRNKILLFAILAVVLVGSASRLFPIGVLLWDKYLGDALYAVLFYLLLSLVWKAGKPLAKAGISFVFVLAVETFQLTHIPLRLSASPNLVLKALSIVLGTTFAWWDIIAYMAGIVGVYLVDSWVQ